MLERDFLKLVVTRQITADLATAEEWGEGSVGKWQFAVMNDRRPLTFACGEYATEKGAIRAAVRRHHR